MPSRTARAITAPKPSRLTAIVALAAVLSVSIGVAEAQQSKTPGVAPLGPAPTGSEVIKAPSDDVRFASANMPMGPVAYAGDGAYAGEMPPMSAVGSGGYFNPTIGSHIRARYNTRSYGQQEGTFDLGTMRLMELDGGFAFLDGQVTLNDESRVGYNLGAGYRWLTLPMFPFSPDDQKIMGISIWSDGQTFGAEQFVPQVGVGFEMLGDRIDFRANGYVPLGPTTRTRDFSPTGDFNFSGNSITDQLVGVQDTLLTVAEAELAGRLGNLDAWAFGSVYGFRGGVYEEVGGKLGLRGYATPDVLLSIAVTNDDLFDTRAVFNATWFIGRTRAENCPSGVLTDRFREPVLRNQYIAAAQDRVFGARNPLLDTDNELIRVVHVNSGAADGGDGTFENPYNEFSDVNQGAEMEGDIILVHAGTSYTNDGLTLLDNQRLLGEGVYDNGNAALPNEAIRHTVTAQGSILVELPETFDGAFDTASPIVNNGAGFTAVTMADANEVNNLRFDGGDSAITSGPFDPDGLAGGAGDPTLQNLIVSNTIGDAIVLNSFLRTDTDPTPNVQTVEFNVLIDEVQLSGVGGSGILIDASDDDGFGNNVSDNPNIALNESIDITNVTSTGGTGVGIDVRNTHDGTDVNITDYTYDGEATALGALAFTNVGGEDGQDDANNLAQVTVSNSSLTGGATGVIDAGIAIVDSAAQFTIQSNVTIDNVGGTAILVDGDTVDDIAEGDVNIQANITNADGRSVIVRDLSESSTAVTFSGEITDTGDGIQATNNTDGTIVFNGPVDINSDSAADAVSLTMNSDANSEASVNFNNGLTVVSTGGGEAFVATGGGEVGVAALDGNSNPLENTLSTDGSTALRMTGVQVATGGATFTQVDATNAVNGVVLDNVTGGTIQLGGTGDDADAADVANRGGTISAMTGDAVVITNTENVVLNGLVIQDPAIGQSGIAITHDNSDGDNNMTVAINNTNVTTNALTAATSGTGVTVNGSNETADSTFVLNIEGAAVSNTGAGFLFNGMDGDVNANNTTVLDVNGTGIDVQDSDGTISFLYDDTDPATFELRAVGTAINVDGGSGGAKEFGGDIQNTAGDAVVITGTENPGITVSGNVTNSGGRIVNISNNDGGNITFSGDLNGTGEGVLAQNNSGDGVLNFVSNVNLNTGANTAVALQNNVSGMTSYDVNFTMTGAEQLVIQTDGDIGFFANQGGTLSITGAGNTINTMNAVGLVLTDTEIDTTDGVTFESVDVSAGGAAANGVQLTNTTGGVITIGENDAMLAADAGGTISGTTGAGIALTNAENVVLNRLRVENTDGNALSVTHQAANTNGMNVSINDSQLADVNNAAHGIEINGQGTGAFNFTADGVAIDGVGGDGVRVTNLEGDADFNDTDIDGTTGDAVLIVNTAAGATVDFDTESSIGVDTSADADVANDGIAGRGVAIEGGEGSVTHNGDIDNVTGLAIEVAGATGGNHLFGGDVTSDQGLRVTGNTDTTVSFVGNYDLQTGNADAVVVENNTDTTANFSNLEIDNSGAGNTGRGFVATNGTGSGTTVSVGGATTIATETGTALVLDDVASAGVTVNTVTVDGATNAVNLNEVTGGVVTVGNTTDASTVTTTGAAVVVNDSANLTVRNMDITTAFATSIDVDSTNATDSTVVLDDVTTPTAVTVDHTGDGNVNFTFDDSTASGSITLNHTGDGTFDFNTSDLTVTGGAIDANATNGGAFDFFANDLSIATGNDDVALDITVGGSVPNADISLSGADTAFSTGDAAALAIASSSDVRFLMEDATLTNNSATQTATVSPTASAVLNATIESNTLTNNGVGDNFLLLNGPATTTNLLATSNVAPNAQGIVLQNDSGNLNQFRLRATDAANVKASNGGNVLFFDNTGTPPEDDTIFTFDEDLLVTPPSN